MAIQISSNFPFVRAGRNHTVVAMPKQRQYRHPKRRTKLLLANSGAPSSSLSPDKNSADVRGTHCCQCSRVLVRLCLGLIFFFAVVVSNHLLWQDSVQEFLLELEEDDRTNLLGFLTTSISMAALFQPRDDDSLERESTVETHANQARAAPLLRQANDDQQLQQPPQQQQQQQKSVLPHAQSSNGVNVFFHAYAGPTPENQKLTKRIVGMQLRLLETAIEENKDSLQWTLQYGTVGQKGVVTPQLVDKTCKNVDRLECHYRGHAANGHEESTLQRMRDFCQANPNDVVVYIHTKGSLHETDFNKRWRRPLTMGAMRPTCLERLMDPDESEMVNFNETTICNTCGLQLYPLWNIMYPGNMFSARCDYVAKLADLNEYNQQMSDIVNMTLTNDSMWSHELYQEHFAEDKEGVTGIGRYSNEQWIGSHPTVRPCDLMGQYTNLYPMARGLQRRPHFLPHAKARRAPRVPLQRGNWYRFDANMYTTAARKDARTSAPYQYYLLPGMLYRFFNVYKVFPPDYSWIWDYYPNGNVWKAKVQDALTQAKDDSDAAASLIW
eukprot:CAMPEP_0168787700 /NCGR_PEP_ID=MMETSP0725-20121227/11941_1 /TAXON_ID=265536 /ORGANISM="Amphiprora sp., Strain CCMP467" /LENGTH=552 /DNA_ID=CAMNT_0008837925 /DNA_START=27 /DNA_END=1685 /DNA_ORIENTATION=+